MNIASITEFLKLVQSYRLVEARHWSIIETQLAPAKSDPRGLARELVSRGMMTPYQANELFLGRGGALLLGSYVLLEKLGEGGMGAIFKARNWKLERIVALKLIRKNRLESPAAVQRFHREIRVAAQLNHPNIVLAYDADQVGSTNFLVMEYVEGTDLSKVVKKNGPLTIVHACDAVRQAALGLQHAFERGLVHRDIKPHNLLLTNQGTVKILDMGLVRITGPSTEDSSTLTQEGMVMGTLDYMAPEQAMDSHHVDTRVDLYSLGCTFYYLLCGKPPFAGGSAMEKLLKHREQPPPPVVNLRPDTPAPVAMIVHKLMNKNPQDRYQTPAELVGALQGIQDLLSVSTVPVMPQRPAEESPSTVDWGELGAPTHSDASSTSRTNQPDVSVRKWMIAVLVGILVVASLTVAGLLTLVMRQKGSSTGQAPRDPAGKGQTGSQKPPLFPGGVSQTWIDQMQQLPAEEQAEAVFAKLKELNEGYDDQHPNNHWEIKDGKLVSLTSIQPVLDISPLHALKHLETLDLRAVSNGMMPPPIVSTLDLSPLRGLPLKKVQLNGLRVTDLSPLADCPIEHLSLSRTHVSDLTPLSRMPLRYLSLSGSPVRELSPLKGRPIKQMDLSYTEVDDIADLAALPIEDLKLAGTRVRNLEPIRALKLKVLDCSMTPVEDLSPIEGMAATLGTLRCHGAPIQSFGVLTKLAIIHLFLDVNLPRDGEVLRGLQVHSINETPRAAFWSALEPGPDHEAFILRVTPLPPADQLKEIGDRLKVLNPDSTCQMAHVEQDGKVVELRLTGNARLLVITPLAALKDLRRFTLQGCPGAQLHPLAGLPLESLTIDTINTHDLSPLAETPLKELTIHSASWFQDLRQLARLKLTALRFPGLTRIADLSPLAGMPLEELTIGPAPLRNVGVLPAIPTLKRLELPHDFVHHDDVLRTLKLNSLNRVTPGAFWQTQAEQELAFVRRELTRLNGELTAFKPTIENGLVVSLDVRCRELRRLDPISTLRKLRSLIVHDTSDLEPLAEKALSNLPLAHINLDYVPERDAPILREIKTLTTINGKPVKDYGFE